MIGHSVLVLKLFISGGLGGSEPLLNNLLLL